MKPAVEAPLEVGLAETAVVDVPPTPSASVHPGVKERGVQAITVFADGRDAVGAPLDPSMVFDLAQYEHHKLWDTTSHTLEAGQPLPEVFKGRTVYTWSGANEHYTFCRPDYIRALFFEPVQVYVLLVSTTKVPQWLRNDFVRLPESKASMAICWQLGLHSKVMAVLSQKLALVKGARMHVWERKEHCVPGVAYTFGGTEGNSPLEDYTYLLAWRKLDPGEAVNTGERGGVESLVESEESKEDRLALLRRVADAVMEDDLDQLRRSVDTYNARARGAGGGWPRPSYLTSSGMPLTTAAALRNAQPRLVLYLAAQGAELDDVAFKYILNNAKALNSAGYCDVQHFVLSYIVHQRNPIASAMSFAQVLDDCANANSAKAKEWRELAGQLRLATVDLVACLEKLDVAPGEDGAGGEDSGGSGGGGGEGGTVPPAISDLLDPRGVACSVNDASPLEIAYDTKDLDFISAPVVQGYLQDRWLGPDYILLALQEKGAVFHYQDHHLMLRLIEGAGFVGSMGQPFMRFYSYLIHMLVFASRAFFDSPRGRWMFKMMLEVFFLYIFHSIQLMPDEGAKWQWQHIVYVLYVAGMLVDELEEGVHQYRGRVAAYFQSGFNIVESMCWLMLTACIALKVAMWTLPDGENNPAWDNLAVAKDFIYNTASIFVWARLLQYLIPLYDGMGSQLMVISLMFREVFKFAIPGMVLLTGVTFAIFAMFRDRDIPELATFPNTMLKLFRTFLGETMFDLFVDENTTIYNLYGNIITLLYTLVATVVLANLLIALISYHFQPEKTESQSKFQMAEILAHYEFMVDKHLIGAPFSVPYLLLRTLLPSGMRQKGSSSWLAETFSLSPMDGIVVSGENTDNKFMSIGTKELPYMIYLLTFYPACLGLSWAIYFGMAPYCIIFFTLSGYSKWTGGGGGKASLMPNKVAPTSGSANAGAAAPDATAAIAAGATPSADMLELSPGSALGPSAQQGDGDWDKSQRLRSGGRLLWRALVYVLTRPLWLVVGALGYLVLLGGLLVVVWLGVYTWCGKLAFHSYWIVRGCLQGWFGESNVVLAKHEGTATKSTTTVSANLLARLQDRTWVRTQQAMLKDGGQVLTRLELARALRRAGFRRYDVAAAAAGALTPAEASAGPRKYWEARTAAAAAVPSGARGARPRNDAVLEYGVPDSSSDSGPGGQDSSDDERDMAAISGARRPIHSSQSQQRTSGSGSGAATGGDAVEAAAAAMPSGRVIDPATVSKLARRVARRVQAELREAVAGLRGEVAEVVRTVGGGATGPSASGLRRVPSASGAGTGPVPGPGAPARVGSGSGFTAMGLPPTAPGSGGLGGGAGAHREGSARRQSGFE